MLELVELEVLELLDEFGFESENAVVIKGSAMLALSGDQGPYGEPCIHKLIETLDSYIPLPDRDTGSPLLMPIDNMLTVQGRGTVVVGNLIPRFFSLKNYHLVFSRYNKTGSGEKRRPNTNHGLRSQPEVECHRHPDLQDQRRSG